MLLRSYLSHAINIHRSPVDASLPLSLLCEILSPRVTSCNHCTKYLATIEYPEGICSAAQVMLMVCVGYAAHAILIRPHILVAGVQLIEQ